MCDLKAAGDAAETIELGREFQTETTRLEKKLLRMFNLASGIWRRNWWPLDEEFEDGTKNAWRLIEEKPLTILKQVIKSEMRRRCSSDFKFNLERRSKYVKSLNPGSLLVKERWTLSIKFIAY